MSLALLFYLPVGWDVILGRSYFYYLCNKDAGIHIYQTIELGPEHWGDDGYPNFYTYKGDFDKSFFNKKYEFYATRTDRTFTTFFNIKRSLMQVIESETGEVLGERVRYLYWGGWVWNMGQPFSAQSSTCQQLNEQDDNPLAGKNTPKWYRKFTSYIFVNRNNIKEDKL